MNRNGSPECSDGLLSNLAELDHLESLKLEGLENSWMLKGAVIISVILSNFQELMG